MPRPYESLPDLPMEEQAQVDFGQRGHISSRGGLIHDRKHKRARTKGIETYIETVTSRFSDVDKAKRYLQEIRKV